MSQHHLNTYVMNLRQLSISFFFIAGTNFRRQNMTSISIRFWCLSLVLTLKGLNTSWCNIPPPRKLLVTQASHNNDARKTVQFYGYFVLETFHRLSFFQNVWKGQFAINNESMKVVLSTIVDINWAALYDQGRRQTG